MYFTIFADPKIMKRSNLGLNFRIFFLIFISFLAIGKVWSQNSEDRIERDIGPLEGFAEASWGMSYELLREKFLSMATDPAIQEEIEILYEKKDSLLLIRRNGIQYLYRFYKTPEIVKEARAKNQSAGNPEFDPAIESQTEYRENGILFSVGVIFNFVESERILAKLEQKYGKPKKQTLDDKKIAGAAVWELVDRREDPPRGGFILMWREPYKKNPYTRRIDYFSLTIKTMIEKEYKEFFSVQETKTLRDLIQ
jgi:hypothetical protein